MLEWLRFEDWRLNVGPLSWRVSLDLWGRKGPIHRLPRGPVRVILPFLIAPDGTLRKQVFPNTVPEQRVFPTATPAPGEKYATEESELGFEVLQVPGSHLVTGVESVAAAMLISGALARRGREYSYRLEGQSQSERRCNQILLGGPSANYDARALYHDHIEPLGFLTYDEDGIWSMSDTAAIQRGEEGLVLWCKNPQEPAQRILWVSGLGAAGTTAAARFAVEGFTTSQVPVDVQRADEVAVFVRGITGPSGLVENVDYICSHRF